MRLTDFIERNRKTIIKEWVKFAGSLLPWAEGMSDEELQDHAEELLVAVVADMQLPQTAQEKSGKSKGRAAKGDLGRVGRKHATERLETGFNLDQLVSEYRAMRASVLRLWEAAHGDKQGQVTRFNEAIDETLAESTARYSETVNKTRDEFMAILGHDLRNPLNAIAIGAKVLTTSEGLDDRQARVAARILSSAERMARMVGDLLDLTRTRLGNGIPITLKAMDLGEVCDQVIAELEAIYPDSTLRYEVRGDVAGEWDGDRLAQVLSNLVANALQYSGKDAQVHISAEGRRKDVLLRVHNKGPVIPASVLKNIFEPMIRHQPEPNERDLNRTGLGLGLYIAREIVTAHSGSIEVTSNARNGTTFTIHIPRQPRAEPGREHPLQSS